MWHWLIPVRWSDVLAWRISIFSQQLRAVCKRASNFIRHAKNMCSLSCCRWVWLLGDTPSNQCNILNFVGTKVRVIHCLLVLFLWIANVVFSDNYNSNKKLWSKGHVQILRIISVIFSRIRCDEMNKQNY